MPRLQEAERLEVLATQFASVYSARCIHIGPKPCRGRVPVGRVMLLASPRPEKTSVASRRVGGRALFG